MLEYSQLRGLKKVLIVEDSEDEQRQYRHALDGKVEIISAYSIKQAEELFIANPDVSAVIMDACVDSDDIDTIPLVHKMRQTFAGPIVAGSSSYKYCQELIDAGCSHNGINKISVPQVLLKALGIS